jgi:Lar family restriction alleviation protein
VVTQAYPPSDPAQEPEAVALKPCPFCGSSDSFAERYDYSSTYVKCNNCSAHGPTELQEDDREETLGEEFAKRAWNTRPVSLDREALIRWVQSKDPANIGRKTGSQWADEILALIGGRT